MSQEKWELVQAVALSAYLDAIDAMACIEILERGNHLAITASLNEAGAGRAAAVIRHALFDRILFISMRAFDPTRRGDKHLGVAFRLLSEPSVAAMARPADQGKFARAKELWAEALADPRLAKLRHYRNKHAAHLSEPNPDIAAPLVTELFGFARAAAGIADTLADATRVSRIALQTQVDAFEASADAFWSCWGNEG